MATRNIEAISIKLPPFWTEYPAAWFLTVESQFNTRNITVEKTKYDHVLQSLPMEVAATIFDFISSSETSQTPYTDLKKILISRNTMSESKRIEQLLSFEQMGDKKPSQFYLRLKTLAGQSELVNEHLIKELWFRRLPSLVSALVKSSGKTEMKDILEVADNVFETMHHQNLNSNFGMNAIASSSTADVAILELKLQNQKLESEISEIKRMLIEKNNNRNSNNYNYDRNRSPRRFNSNFRGRSKSPRREPYKRFGRNAHRCTPPCNWRNPN